MAWPGFGPGQGFSYKRGRDGEGVYWDGGGGGRKGVHRDEGWGDEDGVHGDEGGGDEDGVHEDVREGDEKGVYEDEGGVEVFDLILDFQMIPF